MGNPELLLFAATDAPTIDPMRTGAEDYAALGAAIYRWPEPPVAATLSRPNKVKLDVLAGLAEGTVELSPAPRHGILDEAHGHFVYPWRQGLREGLRVSAPAAMTTGTISIGQNDTLLIGYWAPRGGDGIDLTVTAIAADGTSARIWGEHISPLDRSSEMYQTRLVSLTPLTEREVRLRIEVSPDRSANGETDPLFFGHLTIIRVSSEPDLLAETEG
jgi:hypothetical protein